MVRHFMILPAAALALAPIAAAHAAAPWSAPQTLTTPNMEVAAGPAVLAGGSGDAIVAFGVLIDRGPSANLAIARRPVGATAFGRAAITTTRPTVARVLPYATSRVIVVSQGVLVPSELRVRFGSTAGALGAVRRVAPGEDVLRYAAAANARGDAVIALISQRPARGRGRSNRLVVVRRAAGRAFGRPETIVGRGGVNNVATAINDAGDIVVAYEQHGRVRTRSRSVGRSWQMVDDVKPAGVTGTQLRVALGPGGRAVLGIFEQELTEGGEHGPGNVLAAVRERGRRFGAPQLLDTFAERFPTPSHPPAAEVALGGAGALIAWSGRVGDGFGVRVASLDGRRFGPPRDVSPAGRQLDGLAVADRGRAAVVWSEILTEPEPAGATIGAAVRAPGAEDFGPPELVSGVEIATGPAAVGFARNGGSPTVAWFARTGASGSAVRASTRAALP